MASNYYRNLYYVQVENNQILSKDYMNLQQENKQLNSILTELEKWLEMMEEKETIGTYSMVQDKIQELKEKYK